MPWEEPPLPTDADDPGEAGEHMDWEEPPPDKHFFDDMKQGKTPHSSVPDPNVCD